MGTLTDDQQRERIACIHARDCPIAWTEMYEQYLPAMRWLARRYARGRTARIDPLMSICGEYFMRCVRNYDLSAGNPVRSYILESLKLACRKRRDLDGPIKTPANIATAENLEKAQFTDCAPQRFDQVEEFEPAIRRRSTDRLDVESRWQSVQGVLCYLDDDEREVIRRRFDHQTYRQIADSGSVAYRSKTGIKSIERHAIARLRSLLEVW